MFAYFLAHQAGKFVVHCVPGACRDDTSFDRLADECHVADDVKQLVPGAFVVPHQRLVLYVADVVGIHVGHFQEVGKLVELLLRNLLLVDDDGIVQVAALDEVGL